MKKLWIICIVITAINLACNQTAEKNDVPETSENSVIQEEDIPVKDVPEETVYDVQEEAVYTVVEEMPQFPGGDHALLKYVNENIKYPKDAETEGLQGRVIVRFIVEKDGTISNVEVVRGVGTSLDEEAVRVLREMPAWTPGKQQDKTVRVWYTIPITFKLG